MVIPSALDVSGDLIAAATTLAGLVLVFLGATSTSYQSSPSFLSTPKLRRRFRRRAWFGFFGFALSLLSALLAFVGKWLHHETIALVALPVFAIAVVWVLVAALLTVWDIKKS